MSIEGCFVSVLRRTPISRARTPYCVSVLGLAPSCTRNIMAEDTTDRDEPQ